jgi:hypothetical protein
VQQLRLREHTPRFTRESREQLKLLLGQLDANAVDAHLARRDIDVQRWYVEHVSRRRPGAAEHGADALDEAAISHNGGLNRRPLKVTCSLSGGFSKFSPAYRDGSPVIPLAVLVCQAARFSR